MYQRRPTLEPLESRELLAVSAAEVGDEPAPIFPVSEFAPADYRVGHFELMSDDWTGRLGSRGLRHDGSGLGVDSGADESDPAKFDPGESWSFRFDQPGLFLGIGFDDFTIGDADRAVLVIGNRELIEIEAQRVVRNFWRPSELLSFEAGETFELRAVAPTAEDLEAATADQLTKPGDDVAEIRAPASTWRIKGIQVLGMDDSTLGGYISLSKPAPSVPSATPRNLVSESASQSLAAELGDAGPAGKPGQSGVVLTRGDAGPQRLSGTADINLTGFGSNASTSFWVMYHLSEPVTESFTIGIHRSPDGITLSPGPALMSYTVPNFTGTTNNWSAGDHLVSLGVNFQDVQEDYFLVAHVDDSTTSNNTKVFAGGLFVNSNGVVHVHGAPDASEHIVAYTQNEDGYGYVDWNSTRIYESNLFAEIHVRTHGQDDTIILDDADDHGIKLWAFGGDGNDNIYGDDEDDYLDGGLGGDTIYGLGGDDEIHAGDAAWDYGYGNYLFGGAGNDEIRGDGMPDWIEGGIGADTIFGGDEIAQPPSAPWSLNGWGGGGGYFDSSGGDYILAGAGEDVIHGQAGNDFVDGGGHADTIYGGADNDYLHGGTGAFDDVIEGGDGDDLLKGGGGDDQLNGGAGNDWVHGEAGNDVLIGGGGAYDNLYGQSGNDVYHALDGDTVNLFWENAGDDRYVFAAGNLGTVVIGVDPNGAAGGTDVLDFSQMAAGITVSLATTQLQEQPSGALDLLLAGGVDIEDVIGTEFDDTILGNNLNNVIEGRRGNDSINGGDGMDELDGGFGDDEFLIDSHDSYLDDLYIDSDQVPRIIDQLGNENHAPHLQPVANRVVSADATLEFQVVANDIDETESNLTFELVGDSHGAMLSPDGEFSWDVPQTVAAAEVYSFAIEVTDTGTPQLKHKREFTVTVLPISPGGLTAVMTTEYRLSGVYEDGVWLTWDSVAGATAYIVQRRVSGGPWEQIGETANLEFNDWTTLTWRLYGYRVAARYSSGETTSYSQPVQIESREVRPSALMAAPSVSSSSGNALVRFRDPHVFDQFSDDLSGDAEVVYTQFVVERLDAASQEWIPIFAAAPDEYEFDGADLSYKYLDTTVQPSTTYFYQMVARTEDFSLTTDVKEFFSTAWPYAADIGLAPKSFYSTLHNASLQDADEETVGFVLALNNNFDEGNTDESGNPVPDNEPDAVHGERIQFNPAQYSWPDDRELQSLRVMAFGNTTPLNGVATTIRYDFPSNIKVWDAVLERELVSGVSYEFDSFQGDHRVFSDVAYTPAWIVVEPVSASEVYGDVELRVTVAPARTPGVVYEDVVRFTIVDLGASLPGDISVDEGDLLVSVPLAGANAELNGEQLVLSLVRDDDAVAMQEIAVTNGAAVAAFDLPRVAGGEISVDTLFHGQRKWSDPIRLLAGPPHTLEAVASQTKYTADGTDTTTITVTIRDEFGNLVEDGTAVSWNITFGDGTFTDGDSTAATETTGGQATITLRAADVPGVEHIVATAGTAATSIDIVATAAEFEIDGVAALDIAIGQAGAVSIFNANVADGTSVFWTLSNGEITGGEEGGRVFAGSVQNGTASVEISATGPWARFGQAIVTATVGGRIRRHLIDIDRSSGFAIELERFVLSGDVTQNGIETLVFAHDNINDPPMFDEQPVWGFEPPPQTYWPAPRDVGYYAETQVTIRGIAGQTYYVDPDRSAIGFEPLSARATLHGLDSNNSIILDGNGTGTFTIRSNGTLGPSQFAAALFSVREGDPFTGAEQETGVMFVSYGVATRVGDSIRGFFGQDTTTTTGMIANMAGGVLVVGDIGSVVKNLWRMVGLSEKDPDYLELSLSGLGLATELAVGVGEVADVPISGVRAIVAAVGKTPFTDALVILLKRGLTNAQDLKRFGLYITRILKSSHAFQVAQQVFTSSQAMEAGVKAADDLGDGFLTGLIDLFRNNTTVVGDGLRVSRFGPSVGRKLADVFGNLDQASLNFFKSLPEEELALAVTDAGYILARGTDAADLRKILGIQQLYGPGFTQAHFLADLQEIATQNAAGFEKIVKALSRITPQVPLEFVYGNVYEAHSLARLLRQGDVADVEIIRKYVPPRGGLTSTDIDYIGVNTATGKRTYYQAKISADSFGSLDDVIDWVKKVQADASADGIADPVIRYVTPDIGAVPSDIFNFLKQLDMNIFISVPLS